MTHEGLVADELRDIALDSDRQVSLGADGDLKTVHGIETVQQSVMIHAGQVLRPLVGGQLTAERIEDVEATLLNTLQSDPQVSDVRRVVIDEVDQANNEITIKIFVGFNNEYEIGVTV